MNKETLVPGLLGVLIGIILTLLIAPMWVGKMGYINYSMMGEKQVMGSRFPFYRTNDSSS